MKTKQALFAIFFLFQCLQGFSNLTTPTLWSPATNTTNINANVTLSWSSVSNATSYQYKISTNLNLAGAAIQSTTSTTVGMSNLRFGTAYYWQVRAVKTTSPVDSSAWSTIWNFTTIDQVTPSSPSNGIGGQSPNVALVWYDLPGINYYDYQIDTSSSFNSPIMLYGSTTASYSYFYTSNLRFGAKYYWRVRARHTSDTTQWSAIWNFTTYDQVTPSSPSNGIGGQSPNVAIVWYNLSGINYYDYQIDTSSSFNSPIMSYGSTTASYTYFYPLNLRFGTKYYWRVRARHTSDTTQWSAIWNFTTYDQVTPSSPSNGIGGQSPNVAIVWYNLSGINYYDYQIDTSSSFNSPIMSYGSTAASYTYFYPLNLRFGTKYYWRVRARHTSDTTQWSAIWNFTTYDQVSPSSPSPGAVDQSANVMLDWYDSYGINYYDYQIDTSSSFNSPIMSYGSTAASYSYFYTSNLRFGTKYYWRVRARHTADTTLWSAIWNFTTLDQASPSSPSFGAVGQSANVLLDWYDLYGVNYYDYQIDTSAGFNSPIMLYGSTASPYSYFYTSNLRFGTKYYWRVRARHTADTTQWSAIWNFTTTDYVTHSSPSNNATGISLNPYIQWYSLSGVTGYQYQYGTDLNFTNPIAFITTTNTYDYLSNLLYGTQYYWRVRAFHPADTSAWSAPWSFTTNYQLTIAPALISPSNNSLSIPMGGTSLVWSSISGATLYEYQYATNSSFTNPASGTTANLNSTTSALLPNTTYYWKVRAGNGSGFSPWSTVWSFTTEIGTGLNEYTEGNNLSLFPNPCVNSFTVRSMDENSLLKRIQITDATGKIIFEKQTDNMIQTDIDVSSIQNGLYYVIINENNGRTIKPVIINH